MRRSRKPASRARRPLAAVRRAPAGNEGRAGPRGLLRDGAGVRPCAIGAGGLSANKREGDRATPVGRWRMRQVLYRPDRLARPRTALPVRPIRPPDGWCDAPGDRNYNRPVRHPYGASAEALWREDGLYDLIVVLGYNDVPRRRGRGSAVFLHVAHNGCAPTEGCIALPRDELLRLVARCRQGSVIDIRR